MDNPYLVPTEANTFPAVDELGGWRRYEWNDTAVFHREPFRWRWGATQLVTFAFVIPRQPDNIKEIDADYDSLRRFAVTHKQTWLPIGFQCGYALLPIYLGTEFQPELIRKIENRFVKHWCVMHSPSLYDTSSGHLYSLNRRSLWGSLYRRYMTSCVQEISEQLRKNSI